MKEETRLALRLAFFYLVFGILWISLSDSLLAAIITDSTTLSHLQTFKGSLFVAITAALVFFLAKQVLQEQSLSDEKLQESEKRLQFALEGSGDGVWDWNPKTDVAFYSKRWQEMIGYTENDFPKTGTAWIEHLHPDDKGRVLSTIQEYFDGSSPYYSVEYRIRCKNGSLKWILARGMLVKRDASGKPERMTGTHTDITERMQIQASLQRSEKTYRSLIHHMMDGLAHCRVIFENGQPVDIEYLAVNPAFEQSSGLKNVVGRRINDLIPNYSRDNPESMEIFGKVATSCIPKRWEHYLASMDRWFAFSIYSPAQGEVVIVSNNITELKKQESQLKQLSFALNRVKESVFLVKENGHIFYVNDEACRALDYSREELLGGMGVPDIGMEMSIESWKAHWQDIKRLGSITLEGCQRTKDGRIFPVEINANYFEYEGSSFTMGLIRDISERKKAEAEQRIAAIAFESREAMMVTDSDANILRVNQAFSRTTGFSEEDVIGKNPRILSSGRQDKAFYGSMWESIVTKGEWKGEVWNKRKNGELFPELLTISAVKDQNGSVMNYIGTFVDITTSKAAEAEIEQLAYYDALTLMPNRRLMLDRLKHALASSSRTGREGALLFIDLDNFKTLNDTLGHDIGDLLLKQVAIRLSGCIRNGDTVARIGGDEFVVVLEDLSTDPLEAASQAALVGNKILADLNQPYLLAIHEQHSTPSIGVVLFNDKLQSIDELMKQADIAMYQAKKDGRNTLRFFDPLMQQTLNSRTFLEGELRRALEFHQFQLYYQIQVSFIEDKGVHYPCGAEALIRWKHPERGLVSPAEFIPLAEESGLILPIGQWVLETACAQLKAWQNSATTCELTLSINVSAKQFRQVGFVDQAQNAINQFAINPTLLKLELTESMLLDDIEDTIKTMHALKKIGVKFSLDDFGTGYSSLQYLKRLPLDQLKIDQAFVRDITSDSSDRAIVRTIIAMANSLNLNVIAEGVETKEQENILLQKGCTFYQGYLFGKPVPILQFEESLESKSE